MKKNFRATLLCGTAAALLQISTTSASAEPIAIGVGLILGGKALLAWGAKVVGTKAAIAGATKLAAAKTATTAAVSTKVATGASGALARAAVSGVASQATRMVISGAMKQTFQSQAANYAARQSAVLVSKNAAGGVQWTYGNWVLGGLTAAQVLQGLGLGSANAAEVNEMVQKEVAIAGLHGDAQLFLKICEHDGETYAIPSGWSVCGNGSEPKMLDQPIDPSKLRSQ